MLRLEGRATWKGKRVSAMDWDHQTFGRWLKYQRVIIHDMSQERLAEHLGVPQAYISRWERGWKDYPNTEPPELATCLELADLFEANFIDLATLCGRWNDRLEKGVLVALGSSNGEQSNALIAQVDEPTHVATLSSAPWNVEVDWNESSKVRRLRAS